jgi:hypothetical protein
MLTKPVRERVSRADLLAEIAGLPPLGVRDHDAGCGLYQH